MLPRWRRLIDSAHSYSTEHPEVIVKYNVAEIVEFLSMAALFTQEKYHPAGTYIFW